MPFGKTIEMRKIDTMRFFRKVEDREPRPRDRSLRGKARIRARKEANRG